VSDATPHMPLHDIAQLLTLRRTAASRSYLQSKSKAVAKILPKIVARWKFVIDATTTCVKEQTKVIEPCHCGNTPAVMACSPLPSEVETLLTRLLGVLQKLVLYI